MISGQLRPLSRTRCLALLVVLPALALSGCGNSTSPRDSPGPDPCPGFPPEAGETWTYRVVGTSATFTNVTEAVEERVGERVVLRLRRTDDPPDLGEYVSCDPDRGRIEVATDWWDNGDPSHRGRHFWIPPLFQCRIGEGVGDSCVWNGTFGGSEQREVSRVLSYESVTVPAGTFANVMKERVTTYDSTGVFDGPVDYWVDEDAGIVRAEEVSSGDAIELMFHTTPGAPGDLVQWSRRYGDTSHQEAELVATDPLGNIIIAGSLFGSLNLGGGTLTRDGAFLAKLDPSGRHVWSRDFGPVAIRSIAVDPSGNVLAAGTLYGEADFGGGTLIGDGHDAFVARYAPSGGHLWSQRFGDGWEQAASGVAADGDGNVIITGWFYNSVNLGGDELRGPDQLPTFFLAKFTGSGQHQWSHAFLSEGYAYPMDIATGAQDDIVVVSLMPGAVDFGGGVLGGNGDLVVVKFTAAAAHLWSRRFDAGLGVGNQDYSVAIDAFENAVIAGRFYGDIDLGGGPLTSNFTEDLFVLKLDAAGSHVWSLAGNTDHERHSHVQRCAAAVDPSGNIILTGAFGGFLSLGGEALMAADGTDVFLAKLDPAGAHRWSRGYGDSEAQWASSVASDPSENIVVVGRFEGALDFGGGQLLSAGDADVFVAKFEGRPQPLQPSGTLVGRSTVRTQWKSLGSAQPGGE